MFPLKNLIHRIALIMYRNIFALCLLVTSEQAKAINFETASIAYRNKNYAAAYRDFSNLADTGDARAQTILGIMYTYGEGVHVDDEQAFYWYQKAAQQEYPPAQFNLGIILLKGSGTPEEKRQARYWLEKAAASGFERAEMALAGLTQNTARFADMKPPSWSQRWNLRLPNQIRDKTKVNVEHQYKVYRAQLGAMRTIEGAQRLWSQILNKDRRFFNGKQPIFREATSLDNSVIRLQVGPFDTSGAANQFCKEVLNNKLSNGCLVLLTY